MSNLKNLSGTYHIDASHSELGFVARHAMVTKVRGAFTDIDGTATTGPNLEGARINVNIHPASVDTGSADRDGHLRSADFFDVETYPLITFVSTEITESDEDTLRVAGDLTIKDVTRPLVIDFEYEGSAVDPFGNERVGLSGKVVVNRKDFGLEWNAALETGGVLVSENITLTFEVSAVKAVAATDGDVAQAEAMQEGAVEPDAAAGDVVDEVATHEAPAAHEAPAPAAAAAVEGAHGSTATLVEDASAAAATAQEPKPAQEKKGFVAWLKRIFG